MAACAFADAFSSDKATLKPAWAMASAGSIRSAWLNERAASIQTYECRYARPWS